jgi:hypothetical protein
MFAGVAEWFAEKILSNAVLGPLIKGVLGWQKQKLDAIGSHEAQVEALSVRALELEKREAEVNAAVVIAEQGNWFTRSVRPAIGWSVVILLWKILVWDKALGQWTHGHTDPLGPDIWSVVKTVLIAYFGGRTVEKTATIVKSIFGK